MLSPISVNGSPLELHRYPANQVNRSLQAWDSADELVHQYIKENHRLNKDTNVLIFNDSFGALSLGLSEAKVFSVTDSVVSTLGLNSNAALNAISVENITLLDSLSPLPASVELIIYKIPKSKQLLEQQLKQIKGCYGEGVQFIAADKAKNIQTSTLGIFEKYLGTTTTSLAVKKSRMVFCQLNSVANGEKTLSQKQWSTPDNKFTICNFANVFARDKLDIGARFFLEHLPNITKNAHVIDLGCGNGVLGLYLLDNEPSIKLTQVDESFMAVASAKATVSTNFPDLTPQCKFVANDCLTGFEENSADHIVCNPPFHQQNAVTDHIAWQMFKDSYKVLKPGGKLTIVGNRQLGYHIKLKRIFGKSKLIASNKKFVILTAQKR